MYEFVTTVSVFGCHNNDSYYIAYQGNAIIELGQELRAGHEGRCEQAKGDGEVSGADQTFSTITVLLISTKRVDFS